ncbi:hypothetical protein [Bifidobacterium callimiconis]|uniref:SWIM zinc finger protein n=1 Tax=Bifidobacterium callimiconis TaxID=2306973 RepID=A0A430FHQ2_9BIFI|nr:hypothetical protein [Bifidobacterium callimiconis]RSX52413.1 SWIM zinc finger protein [Bifidobacterium callimiconis]
MSIPVLTLPEPLHRIQSWLMAHCPHHYQTGYDPDTLRRLAEQGHRDELTALFTHAIVHATDRYDMEYVWFLRVIHPHDFTGLLPGLVGECLRTVDERAAMGVRDVRNPALERLLVEERLSDAPLHYLHHVSRPPYPLLRVLAIRHRPVADALILRGLPTGALHGHCLLADNQAAYSRIAHVLNQYADVFTPADASCVVQRILDRYPGRRKLKAIIGRYLNPYPASTHRSHSQLS